MGHILRHPDIIGLKDRFCCFLLDSVSEKQSRLQRFPFRFLIWKRIVDYNESDWSDWFRTIQRQAFHSLPHLQKLELQHNLLQVNFLKGELPVIFFIVYHNSVIFWDFCFRSFFTNHLFRWEKYMNRMFFSYFVLTVLGCKLRWKIAYFY